MGCGGEWACLGREMRYYVGFGAGSHCFFYCRGSSAFRTICNSLTEKELAEGK